MKKIILIIIALLAAALLVCVLPLPSGASKTVDGVWLRENGTEEPITISLDGTLYRYLFRDYKWSGVLKIPGVIEMKNDERIELAVTKPILGIYHASVFAYDRRVNRFHFCGDLFFDKDMNTIIFTLDKQLGVGGVIAAPATNADEAKALIDALPFGGIVPDGLA